MHTYSGDMIIYIGVGINSVSFNSKGSPRTSTSGRAEVDTRVFSYVVILLFNTNALSGICRLFDLFYAVSKMRQRNPCLSAHFKRKVDTLLCALENNIMLSKLA